MNNYDVDVHPKQCFISLAQVQDCFKEELVEEIGMYSSSYYAQYHGHNREWAVIGVEVCVGLP